MNDKHMNPDNKATWGFEAGEGDEIKVGHQTITPPEAMAAGVDDATDAESVVTQFNALLVSLRDAGIIAE